MTTTTKKTTTKPKIAAVKSAEVVNENLPPNPFAFEVFNLVSKQRTNAKKIEFLKKYENPSLKALFIWNFDESVISMLPDGMVPYSGYQDQVSFKGSMSDKVSEEIRKMHETGSISLGASDTQGRSTIRKEFKHFYHFIKGGNDALNKLRRESMFINILEGLHPLEAEILCLVKDKKLQERYKITKETVSQAYPDITWGNRS
jgi:hypothetical protein